VTREGSRPRGRWCSLRLQARRAVRRPTSVFELPFLPNPHFVEKLRPLDGRESEVREFVMKHEETASCSVTSRTFSCLVRPVSARGKATSPIAVGCTGGRTGRSPSSRSCAVHRRKGSHRAASTETSTPRVRITRRNPRGLAQIDPTTPAARFVEFPAQCRRSRTLRLIHRSEYRHAASRGCGNGRPARRRSARRGVRATPSASPSSSIAASTPVLAGRARS